MLRMAPNPGPAIADNVRSYVAVIRFEILKSDGTPIGTIMASGFAGGAPPPGSPSNVTVNGKPAEVTAAVGYPPAQRMVTR
jgi:hypothetical protein